MLAAHNAERTNAGLGLLALDPGLSSIARYRAADMASKGYFSHYAPDERNVFDLMAAAGIPTRVASENIAYNTYPQATSMTVAMTGFMNSAGHRKNILDPDFRKAGIGVSQRGEEIYYCVVFSGQ